MTLVALGAVTVAAVLQAPDASLSVRVVDTSRSALPGIVVRVTEVENCTTLRPRGSPRSSTTGPDGSVDLPVVSDRGYLVTVDAQGGLEGRTDCLERVRARIAYVFIQLRPDLSQQVTLIQPATGERTATGALALGDFVGVYVDRAGRLYEVALLEGAGGVALSLPSGDVLRFPKRQGAAFQGDQGVISFKVARGRVVRFSVSRPTLQATRLH